jgi:nitrate/TMAO reductase-like tetraheme cytochrome c subunit
MTVELSTLLQVQGVEHGEQAGSGPAWLDEFMHWALNNVPQVVQMAGGPVVLAILTAVVALVIWKRNAIASWWRTAGSQIKAGIYALAGVAFASFLMMGGWVWNYVQHDNEFCNSCHVMHEPFERFAESEHAELGCHDCHQASILASANQLHMWVLNRPDEVGPHAPVPKEVCVQCHVTEDPDSTWQRISATAGHRVHLEADTSALADVTCVTCHGEEVHRFLPADATCGQSGCHASDKTQVVLGDMAGQSGFHCIMCHEFTAPVAESSPLDTVRQALVPGLENCASCHEMESVLVGFQPDVDPHDAVCGTCHNLHTQERPEEAKEKCALCHSPAELSGFHKGIDATTAQNCAGCHEAHTFRVDGGDCLACHADIIGGTPTTGPHRRASAPMSRKSSNGVEALAGLKVPVARVSLVDPRNAIARPLGLNQTVIDQYVAQRTRGMTQTPNLHELPSGSGQGQQEGFDHRAHRDLECTICHSMERSHGEVILQSGRQCYECHHTRPVVDRGCESCHRAMEERAIPASMHLRVWEGARTRELPFDHEEHTALACSTCHTEGPQMEGGRGCADCHSDHHEADRDCAACHGKPPETAHTIAIHTQGCTGSGCHGEDSYGRMNVGRNTCLVCHRDLVDHRPGRACAACHQVAALARASGGKSR